MPVEEFEAESEKIQSVQIDKEDVKAGENATQLVEAETPNSDVKAFELESAENLREITDANKQQSEEKMAEVKLVTPDVEAKERDIIDESPNNLIKAQPIEDAPVIQEPEFESPIKTIIPRQQEASKVEEALESPVKTTIPKEYDTYRVEEALESPQKTTVPTSHDRQ